MAIEEGTPFAFCGRIIEAYYTNPELDTIGVIWSDGEKNREYYVVVDEEDEQFQALLKEYSYESLDETTRNRNEATRQEFRDAFHRYATRNNLYGHGNPDGQVKTETEIVELEIDTVREREVNVASSQKAHHSFEFLLDNLSEFDPDNEQHREQLFKLKLKAFEKDVVTKSKAKTKKTALRKAENPLQVLSAYQSFLK
jgi:hypothetical protein